MAFESIKSGWQKLEARHAESELKEAEADKSRLTWHVPRVAIWRDFSQYLRQSLTWVLLMSAICGAMAYGTIVVIELAMERQLPLLAGTVLLLFCTLAPWMQVASYLITLIRPRQSVDTIGVGKHDKRIRWATITCFDAVPLPDEPEVITVYLLRDLVPESTPAGADATADIDTRASAIDFSTAWLANIHRLQVPRSYWESNLRPFIADEIGIPEGPIDQQALNNAHRLSRPVTWMLMVTTVIWPPLFVLIARDVMADWSGDGKLFVYMIVTMLIGPGTFTALVCSAFGWLKRGRILMVSALGNLIATLITSMLWLALYMAYQLYVYWPDL